MTSPTPAEPTDPAGAVPLVIDLDGTLVRSDLLLETGLAFITDQPLRGFLPLVWLARGKAFLKQSLANATELDVKTLPYDQSVIDLVERARRQGRRVVLATASHRRLAERVAEHLSIFDEVLATDGERNLSARAKRDALLDAFGDKGFDYVGNAKDDLPVWAAARRAYVANAMPSIERRAREQGNVESVLGEGQGSASDWMRELRLHQWLKNLLVFVPLLAAHRFGEPVLVLNATIAFLCFGLCASSVYLLNDLLDLRDDRRHPTKRTRPFAAGRIPLNQGFVAFPFLGAAAFAIALWNLPASFAAVLALYYAVTFAYSLALKKLMVVDVMVLAGLYILRVLAGALAVGVALSFWLLAFTLFMFLSLALIKRYTELLQLAAEEGPGQIRGRGYRTDDLEMIASLGAAAGNIATLVLALYVIDAQTANLYSRPELIWIACPLLLAWVLRAWMLAHRGRMSDDPVVYAISDPYSIALGVAMAASFWVAV